MYPGNEHRYDAIYIPSRHAILEDAFEADAKHPVRRMIIEVAAILGPMFVVGFVFGAVLIVLL